MRRAAMLAERPWVWSFAGALLVWVAAIAYTGGQGAGGMATAALSLAVFTVIVGVGQMFVVALGPGNVDLSLPANIGLASAVAMKVMDGSDAMIAVGGLNEYAAGNRARLIRYDRATGKQKEYKLSINRLLKNGDSSANVRLEPGDVIIIPESMF